MRYLCTCNQTQHSDNTQKIKAMVRLSKEQIKNLPEWIQIPNLEDYEVNCHKGTVRHRETGERIEQKPNTYGYPTVRLSVTGCEDDYVVYRLVNSAAFGYYGIDTSAWINVHLKKRRQFPTIDNLALCTAEEFKKLRVPGYGMTYPTKIPHLFLNPAKPQTRWGTPMKPVAACKDGEPVMWFEGINETGLYGFTPTAVSHCCNGKAYTHMGYEWRFLETTDTPTALAV